MRSTIDIDERLLEEAKELTRLKKKWSISHCLLLHRDKHFPLIEEVIDLRQERV